MHIAKTVQSVAHNRNPLVSLIMNRSIPLTKEFCEQVMSLTHLSYHGRNPKPSILKNGKVRKTNLDLLSLLADLHKRSARVELIAYDNQLPYQAFAGEQHVGGTKRFGHITGLISHSEHLSFSVQIKDESVLKSSDNQVTAGAYRTYMLADYAGAWHKGWHGFTWDMSPAEQAYLERRKLLWDGNVDYEDYVHRNRVQSVMGAPYLLLKLLWQRIEDELSFFEAELKRLEKACVECPKDLESPVRFKIAEGESQSVEVPTFTMHLDGLKFVDDYQQVSDDVQGYGLAHQTIRFLAYKLRPTVQFMMRADEVAFYRFGLEQDFVSNWIRGPQWTHSGAWAASITLGDTLRLSYQKGVTEKKVAI
jgi:hypothetical protein